MKIICRICVVEEGEFFTLDSEVTINDTKLRLIDIFNECFHLNANSNDYLPQMVCAECLINLKLYYKFVLRAIKSDEELRSQLKEVTESQIDEHMDVMFYYDPLEATDECNNEEQVDDVYEIDTCSSDGLNRNIPSEPQTRGNGFIKQNAENTAIDISRIQDETIVINKPSITYEPLKETRKCACPDCGRKYSSELKLEQHRQLHILKKEKKCRICDAVFNSIFEHTEHMKTHCEERKFLCEFCSKSFMSRASLHSHQLTHYNIRPFKCEFCDKEFGQKSSLKTHLTLHTGKSIKCEICNHRFSRTAHLNIHMRQHNNIRPYTCEHCPNTYIQKSHLDRHIASCHMGIRFKCSFCDRDYTKKSSLNIHIQQEHSETVSNYKCDFCEKEFTNKKSLYHHIRTKHPEYKTKKKPE